MGSEMCIRDRVYLDRLHPGPRGQVLIARSLLEVLGAQADVDQGATSS